MTIRERTRICAVAVMLAVGSGFGQGVPSLEEIRKGLASETYATRVAAEGELQKVSYDQMGALLTMAQGEKDPEVKARLDGRIAELQLPPLRGGVGMGTWDATAQFKDVLVQTKDGKVLLKGDFAE